MPKLEWDKDTERLFETGTDRGVIYPYTPGLNKPYGKGVAWNGLTAVTEKPTGAEPNALYADNIKYLELRGAETFEATIEAYTYPDEFAVLDGTAFLANGVSIGQQKRGKFGFCYRTRIGNDVDGDEHGYKIHLLYGCSVSPSEKNYTTVNDTPDAVSFSWDLTTTPVPVIGPAGTNFRPTALVTIDSTKVPAAKLTALENKLYGTAGSDPELLMPDQVYALFTQGS